ncbi:MAG: ornithine carbamoyltransferase, partial [Cyanobacteriota bacterium]|nr:ornithine carbamoyltransferase [Cyanobacteriota bacterium]
MAVNPQGVAAVLADLKGRDFLSCADFTAEQTIALLELSRQLKSGDRRI